MYGWCGRDSNFGGACFIGKRGLRADPAKAKAIVEWPVFFENQKDLRKWVGLANYLHKYSDNYADMVSHYLIS